MKRYEINIKGVSNQIQNRLSRELNKEFSEIPRDKREEWQDNNYLRKAYFGRDNKTIEIPDINIKGLLVSACKKYKIPPPKSIGRTWTGYIKSCLLIESSKFDYREVVPFATMVNGNPSSSKGGSKVYNVRPMFKEWSMSFIIVDTDDSLNKEIVEGICSSAGKFVGFSDYRPEYGRFIVTNVNEI